MPVFRQTLDGYSAHLCLELELRWFQVVAVLLGNMRSIPFHAKKRCLKSV